MDYSFPIPIQFLDRLYVNYSCIKQQVKAVARKPLFAKKLRSMCSCT